MASTTAPDADDAAALTETIRSTRDRIERLRVENGAVVHFASPDSLLDDEIVARQLDSKLTETP